MWSIHKTKNSNRWFILKNWLRKRCRTSFKYNQNWKKSKYRSTNWKRGIKYEQYIVMKLKFIREHFQIVNTQTILGNQTKHYEFFHRIYLWQNWSLWNLLFCSKIGCDQVFENLEDLETHLIEGSEKNRDSNAPRLFMDIMKSRFCF